MNYLNKYTKILDKGFVGLVAVMGSDELIETSARVSYAGNNKKKDTGRLINYLLRKKHSSPFEQVEATFHVKLPLFCATQFIRHRVCNFNFLSHRYCEPQEEVYVPNWREQAKKNKQGSGQGINNQELSLIYKDGVDMSFGVYRDLINHGVSRELARCIIPTSTYTECYMKCDLRNWFHFLGLRSDEHAQYEAQVYSDAIGSFLRELFPISFEAFLKHQFNTVTFTFQELEFLIKCSNPSFMLEGITLESLKLENESLKIWSTDSEIDDFLLKLNFKPKERFNINKYKLLSLKEVSGENN